MGASQLMLMKLIPSIAHLFTATWCNPCVEVEHAMEDVANETNLVMLTFHRFAGETEDPFGTENSEKWWKEWFNDSLPLQPTAIINGVDSFIGANQGSYNNMYAAAVEKPALNSLANPTMVYTDFNSTSSILEWNVTNTDNCQNVKVFVNFVEEEAYFPNGSNGLKNYTHIVHHVKEMPGESGTADISQDLSEINSYDGDDLKLVITFGCMNSYTDHENSNSNGEEAEKSTNRIPHLGFISTIMTILLTSIIISRRDYSERIN